MFSQFCSRIANVQLIPGHKRVRKTKYFMILFKNGQGSVNSRPQESKKNIKYFHDFVQEWPMFS